MRILFLITGWSMGGAETQVYRMAEYLSKNEHKVAIVSILPVDSSFMANELSESGIDLLSLNVSHKFKFIHARKNLLKIIKEFRPNVLHSHMFHANILARYTRKYLKNCKVINTVHGEEEYLGIRKKIYKISDKKCDYTVCCGKVLANQASELGIISKDKLKVIYNGLDITKYSFDNQQRKVIRDEYKIGDKTFLWGTVGRIEPVKNYKRLIDEFSKFVVDNIDSVLMFVGEGSQKEELISYAKEKKIEDKIIFAGRQKNVVGFLSAFDAFALSSLHEGLPLSLQEAAAVGLPLLATNVGGCNEVIQNNENGFVTNDKYFESMKKITLLNFDELNKMKKKSLEISKYFSIENTMKEWLLMYE